MIAKLPRFENFYDDIDFMAALFYNYILNKYQYNYEYEYDLINKCYTDKKCYYDDEDIVSYMDIHIYEIARYLNSKIPDDYLSNIITNRIDDLNNRKLFDKYLNKKNIKFSYPKKTLIAKVFYYILNNRIDFDEGIRFVHYNVSNRVNITEYIGDDVGIEKIVGDYFAIDDGDITYEEDIKKLKILILEEMQQYIQNNLEQTN